MTIDAAQEKLVYAAAHSLHRKRQPLGMEPLRRRFRFSLKRCDPFPDRDSDEGRIDPRSRCQKIGDPFFQHIVVNGVFFGRRRQRRSAMALYVRSIGDLGADIVALVQVGPSRPVGRIPGGGQPVFVGIGPPFRQIPVVIVAIILFTRRLRRMFLSWVMAFPF